MRIKRFKLKDNVTKEQLTKLGFTHGGIWVKTDAKWILWRDFGWYSINVVFGENINDWNDFDYVLVLDEDFGQPYIPFYDSLDKDILDSSTLGGVVENYNKFMSNLDIFEEIKE